MKLTIILLFAVTIYGCTSPVLKVKARNSDKGFAFLINTENQKMDTIIYKDYSFTYSGKIDKPTLFELYFEEIKNWQRPIYLILSKETTEISFDSLIATPDNVQTWLALYPNRPKFISDPNRNESFYHFQCLWANFSDSIINMSDSETKSATRQIEREELYNRFLSNCDEIISNNKDKLVSAVIIEYLMNNNLLKLSKIQEQYSVIDTVVQQSYIGIRIGKEAGLQQNTKAPVFKAIDISGKVYSLDGLKGKKVLLHFWSTTCAPCILEIPELSKLNNNNKDLIIINVSLDTDSVRWKHGVYKLGMAKMINTCDFHSINGKIAQDYFIKSIPANYLISEQGEIISKTEDVKDIIIDLNKYEP
jgi:thiol-disulfide isomerase/thioredoxin